VKNTLPDGSEYQWVYTDLTTIVLGGCVCIDYAGGAVVGQNPRATLPDNTGSVPHRFAIACMPKAAAGGLWVQTYGRCKIAKVDGATDTTVGCFLKPVNGAQYLTIDHATIATVEAFAIEEEVEAAAYNAQTVATGNPSNQIWITGNLVTF
jgi:hypothetical protein